MQRPSISQVQHGIDEPTLTAAAAFYAKQFELPTQRSVNPLHREFSGGRGFVLQEMHSFRYKDEFEFIKKSMRDILEPSRLKDFDRVALERFEPRRDDVFESLLSEWLAINPAGEHIAGKIGRVKIGGRVVGRKGQRVMVRDNRTFLSRLSGAKREIAIAVDDVWPIYAGEGEERIVGSGIADDLPEGAPGLPVGANNPQITNVAAIAMCDTLVDSFDGGAGAAIIQGYTTAQPAGADVAVSGQTLLFAIVMDDPAFGAAADGAPGGVATAAGVPISDADGADATGTLSWCRASTTTTPPTPITTIMDGEAGTSSADYIFNTLAIVAAASVSITAMTVMVPEG